MLTEFEVLDSTLNKTFRPNIVLLPDFIWKELNESSLH